MLPPARPAAAPVIASVASLSPPLPNPVIVPYPHLRLEVLRRPLDSAWPFEDASFLEIERSLLDGREDTTCGGRWLNDKVMDALYTLLIDAGREPRISDGVDAATKPAGPASRTWRRRRTDHGQR